MRRSRLRTKPEAGPLDLGITGFPDFGIATDFHFEVEREKRWPFHMSGDCDLMADSVLDALAGIKTSSHGRGSKVDYWLTGWLLG